MHNFNVVCHTGFYGYIHDVAMTLCAPSVKMYSRVNLPLQVIVFWSRFGNLQTQFNLLTKFLV